jgi:hypothetical protein
MPTVRVLPQGDRWKVEENGTDRGTFDTQEGAVSVAREIARATKAEFELHGADGRIREKDSYGNDPSNMPG